MKNEVITAIKKWLNHQSDLVHPRFKLMGLDSGWRPRFEIQARRTVQAKVGWSAGRDMSNGNSLRALDSLEYVSRKTGLDYRNAQAVWAMTPEQRSQLWEGCMDRVRATVAPAPANRQGNNVMVTPA